MKHPRPSTATTAPAGARRSTVRLVLHITPRLRARLEREVSEMGLSTLSHVAELALADFLDARRLRRGEVHVEWPEVMPRARAAAAPASSPPITTRRKKPAPLERKASRQKQADRPREETPRELEPVAPPAPQPAPAPPTESPEWSFRPWLSSSAQSQT